MSPFPDLSDLCEFLLRSLAQSDKLDLLPRKINPLNGAKRAMLQKCPKLRLVAGGAIGLGGYSEGHVSAEKMHALVAQ